MNMIPSGEQFTISFGDQAATIVEVGGGIRTYEVAGRAVLHPYDADQMCDGAHGSPLVPWPNRLADGRYTFSGTDHQVALTEPEKNNAIHGFLRWRSWHCVRHDDAAVTMETRLHPLRGYPFGLHMAITYELSDAGLTVNAEATNIGEMPLPYGYGQHPYLSPGDGTIDDAILQFEAGVRIVTDTQRQLPTGEEAVEGTQFDFHDPRKLGATAIDFAFHDLVRDDFGRAWVRLTGSDGRTTAIWVDESIDYLELYTADTLAPQRRRRGLGVEPMTCPPNALATGDSVIRLEPGESTVATWGALLS